MNLDQLIAPAVPILSPGDTGDTALAIMEDNRYSQLPIVLNDKYEALVKEDDILGWTTPGAALSTAGFLNFKPAILASAHPFEAMKILNQMELSVLPVIDGEHHYLGAITRDTLLKYITENSGIDTQGGIIVLEVAPRNYTLYEIARLCENEDVIILNSQVHTNEMGMLEVTLKLNRSAIESVVASLERHNYHVKETHGELASNEDIEGNYNLLMNYINM